MSQINVDFSDVQDFEPLPNGTYEIEVAAAEVKPAQTGTPMLTLQLVVTEGEHAGRKLFDNLMLAGDGRWRTKQALGVLLGTSTEGSVALDTEDIIHARATVYVRQRIWKVEDGGDGGVRNQIGRYVGQEGGDKPPQGRLAGLFNQ